MDINPISVLAYEKTSVTKAEEKLTITDSAVSYSKTEESATVETAAAVYEKAETQTAKITKRDAATIDKMRAELEQKKEQLRSLVEKMLSKQGKTLQNAGDIWDMLRKGEVEVDPETAAQAEEDLSEDGYWGVEQTSDRLVSFAKALAGNDPAYADELIEAVKKGFGAAEKSWGDKLPEICQKTLDATISKMEAWRDGNE